MNMDVDQRIERLIQEHERAIARMDRADARMDRAEARMDRAEERMDRAEERMNLADKRFGARMEKLEQRSNKHEAEFERRNVAIQKLIATGMRLLVANQEQGKETERKINALVEAQMRNEAAIRNMTESLKRPRNGGSHS
jgi:chromosome segregation ATPase